MDLAESAAERGEGHRWRYNWFPTTRIMTMAMAMAVTTTRMAATVIIIADPIVPSARPTCAVMSFELTFVDFGLQLEVDGTGIPRTASFLVAEDHEGRLRADGSARTNPRARWRRNQCRRWTIETRTNFIGSIISVNHPHCCQIDADNDEKLFLATDANGNDGAGPQG
jgi:hypothetical protein